LITYFRQLILAFRLLCRPVGGLRRALPESSVDPAKGWATNALPAKLQQDY